MAVPTVVFDGNVQDPADHCGDSCCWKFTITLPANTETSNGHVHIQLFGGPNAKDSCIDLTCWTNQGYPTCATCPYVMKHNDLTSPNDYDIEFITGEPAGYSFDVYICGSNDCLKQFPLFTWEWEDGYGIYPPHDSSGNLTACYGNVLNGCAYGCSWISGSANNSHNECWASFCFESDNLTGPLCTFTLNFYPPLTACQVNGYDPTGTPHRPICYSSDHEVDNGIFDLPTGWTATNDPVTGNIVFSASSPGTCIQGACQGFCFSIPDCDNATRVVTVVSPDPCSGTVTVPLKWSTHEVVPITQPDYQQNYPNPVDVSTGFKTTIPFSTSEKGMAYLHVVDMKGNVVFTDNEQADYAGQHFFYLTADNLSAGTYYYQIEFPKGVPIVTNKMLVVR